MIQQTLKSIIFTHGSDVQTITENNGLYIDKFVNYSVYMKSVTLTTSTFSFDLSLFNNFLLNTNSISLTNIDFINLDVGRSGKITIFNPSSVSHSITYSANVAWKNNYIPTLKSSSVSYDVFYYYCISSSKIILDHVSTVGLVTTAVLAVSYTFNGTSLGISNLQEYNSHANKNAIETVFRQTIANQFNPPIDISYIVIASITFASITYDVKVYIPQNVSVSEATRVSRILDSPVVVFHILNIEESINPNKVYSEYEAGSEEQIVHNFFIYNSTSDPGLDSSLFNLSTVINPKNPDGTAKTITEINFNPSALVTIEQGTIFTETPTPTPTFTPTFTATATPTPTPTYHYFYLDVTLDAFATKLPGWTLEVSGTDNNRLKIKHGTEEYLFVGNNDVAYTVPQDMTKIGLAPTSSGAQWQFVAPVQTSNTHLSMLWNGIEQFRFVPATVSGGIPELYGVSLGFYWKIGLDSNNLVLFNSSDGVLWNISYEFLHN